MPPLSQPCAPARARRRGLTLIELLVAIVIVGILAAAAVAATGNSRQSATEGLVRSELARLQAATLEYYQDHGAYPNTGWTTSLPGFAFTLRAGWQFYAGANGSEATLAVKQVGPPATWCEVHVGTAASPGVVSCVSE